MSGEAFQTIMSCDMRTSADGRSAEYAPSRTGEPRWLDVEPGGGEHGWADCYLNAEQAVRISADAVRDQEITGETGDHPDKRATVADLLDATADLVRLLALDHAYDSHVTDERWAARLDAMYQVLDRAYEAGGGVTMPRDDFAELPLHLEDMPGDYRPTVEAHLTDGTVVTCHGVTSNPVRHQGYWTVFHLRWPNEASTMIPADRVGHWVVLSGPAAPGPTAA